MFFIFESNKLNLTSITPLRPINNEELSLIHTQKFIEDIHNSATTIANAAEIFILRFMSISTLNDKLLLPLKWQTAGSILAAKVALEQGWSINIGGGFHHASAHQAQGFCLFADISLIMKILWNSVNDKLKFMIIDLDAHQGFKFSNI
jgi:histone deacetylase 11